MAGGEEIPNSSSVQPSAWEKGSTQLQFLLALQRNIQLQSPLGILSHLRQGTGDGLEALVKFSAQRLRIRKRLRSTHRIVELLLHLFSYTLPPQYRRLIYHSSFYPSRLSYLFTNNSYILCPTQTSFMCSRSINPRSYLKLPLEDQNGTSKSKGPKSNS